MVYFEYKYKKKTTNIISGDECWGRKNETNGVDG